MGTGRTHLTPWLAAAGAVLVVAGLWAWQASPGSSVASPPGQDTTTGTTSPASGPSATPEPDLAAPRPGAPRRIVIPALDVAAPVLPVRAVDDTLVPPSDPSRLGWWAGGAEPGAARGSALVAGHTVHTGGGALDHLASLAPGDRVVVLTAEARIAYEVRRVRTYSKGRIDRDAERLFSQDVPGRLVLVTCADWDGSGYLSNVVVLATPVPA